MNRQLSSKEKKRRELILQREFANTTLSQKLLSKTITSLRDMPIAPLIEPFASEFTSEEKQELYDAITTSSFYQKSPDFVRAWFQLRIQDVLERGHLPSNVEILCIREVFGRELAGSIVIKAIEFSKDLDKETREYVVSPKNEIEAIIFKGLLGEVNGPEKSTQP